MSEIVKKYVGRKIEVFIPGPKGEIKIKGKLLGLDENFLEIQEEKGMLGGKPKTVVLSRFGIAGFRIEEK
ncbi:MAG: hypothetical protein ACE5Z5_08780 [Candidatus Bathyarchaeia archaeon]